MKTLPKLLFAALLLGAASVAVAGPSPQFWNRPVAKTLAPSEVAKPATPAVKSDLTCARMLVPRMRATKQSAFTVVTCTSEMMKNDWRCQQVCRK